MQHHVTGTGRSPNGGAIRLELFSDKPFTEAHSPFRWEYYANHKLVEEGWAEMLRSANPANFSLHRRGGGTPWSLFRTKFPLVAGSKLTILAENSLEFQVSKVEGVGADVTRAAATE
jgi:hypothetical protein